MNLRNAVVTGCSVGLGRATALRLARRRWRVFAGVRSDADADALRKEEVGSGRIEPVQLDVRDRTTIESARTYVDARIAGEGLHALINNAGLAVIQPIEFASEEDLAYQLGVNLLGPIRLIQVFLPALRRARGRIVNVTSGVTKVTQPFAGLYAASKAALDQISLSLRLELAPSGVAVVLIDPGLMRTRMTEPGGNTSDAGMADWVHEAVERYGDASRANAARISASVPRAKPPEEVAELVARAVEAENPRDQYLVGSDARAADLLNRLLPWRAKQALLDRVVFRA
jgi:NAD(P)-dependent dehydrogenase (short-subunit alcohol dehydrogenase family)